MTDLLLNLIKDMKSCLAIALGSGFILGYLYTKLRAKELYKPEFKNLKKRIDTKIDESKKIHTKIDNIKSEQDKYNKELNDKDLELSKFKNRINDLESNIYLLQTERGKIEDQYKKQVNIFNDYKKEVENLKDKFELDDVKRLEEYKHSIKDKKLKIEKLYKQKHDSLEGLSNEVKELNQEISDISYNISSLNAKINKKGQELANATNQLSTIRDELQNRFDKLLENKKEDAWKIEKYKQQLLDIKDKLT